MSFISLKSRSGCAEETLMGHSTAKGKFTFRQAVSNYLCLCSELLLSVQKWWFISDSGKIFIPSE